MTDEESKFSHLSVDYPYHKLAMEQTKERLSTMMMAPADCMQKLNFTVKEIVPEENGKLRTKHISINSFDSVLLAN